MNCPRMATHLRSYWDSVWQALHYQPAVGVGTGLTAGKKRGRGLFHNRDLIHRAPSITSVYRSPLPSPASAAGQPVTRSPPTPAWLQCTAAMPTSHTGTHATASSGRRHGGVRCERQCRLMVRFLRMRGARVARLQSLSCSVFRRPAGRWPKTGPRWAYRNRTIPEFTPSHRRIKKKRRKSAGPPVRWRGRGAGVSADRRGW
jgi:hypothetical protein